MKNIHFEVLDASDLSCYHNNEFDIAVTSMAVHQFEEGLAMRILREMKRISSGIIVADYNCPMPAGFSRFVAYTIEKNAEKDHTRNFMNYMSRGGISWFTDSAGLLIKSTTFRGNGVFVVAECG